MTDRTQRIIGKDAIEIGRHGSIFLRNFKSFGSIGQNIPVSKINLFFGPNSSGKSSVFQAFHLALQTHIGGTHENLIEPLRFSQVVNKGLVQNKIEIGLTLTEPGGSIADAPLTEVPSLNFKFAGTPDDRFRIISTEVTTHENLSFLIDHHDSGGGNSDSDIIRTGIVRAFAQDVDAFNAAVKRVCPEIDRSFTHDDLNNLNSALKTAPLNVSVDHHGGFHPTAERPVDEMVGVALRLIRGCLRSTPRDLGHFVINVLHLGPIRNIHTRHDLASQFQKCKGWERDVEQTAWYRLLKDSLFLDEINVCIGEKFLDLGYEVKLRTESVSPDSPRSLILEETRGLLMERVELDFTAVGVGVSQVIPVVGAVCMHSDVLMFIEQPELHLHPRAQCNLADVFIAKANNHYFASPGHGNNLLFLETHSEHLVLRMLRRIRETTNGVPIPEYLRLTPEDVSILYFKPTPMGTVIHRMEVTPDGDFANRWPDGFFPERATELFDD